MATTTLGKMEQVELREVWEDEAGDFTPWLASDIGLSLLGDTIGLQLELIGQEQKVGPYKADILARAIEEDEDEDHLVIVENQLDKTNHDHLGKLIVYAAGKRAHTVVWIAETFTDEHRQALDWLNENSGKALAFFGLQIELWRIGGSNPAPQFKVVSSPNAWAKEAAKEEDTRALTETKQDQLQFWEEVKQYGQTHHSPIQWRKPRGQHWYPLAVGRAGFWMNLQSFD